MTIYFQIIIKKKITMLKNITAILSKYFSNLYDCKCQFNYFTIDYN